MNIVPDAGTRERLLDAARKVFAECGFKETTVRAICTRAGANLASVNYYFGSKDKLYIAVLEDFFRSAAIRFPLEAGVRPDSPAEDRLKAYIRGFLSRLLGDGDVLNEKLGRLLMTEILDPSERFDAMAQRCIHPTYDALYAIIKEMLPDVEADIVHRCAGSVAGQCLLFDYARGIIQRMCPELSLEADSIESAAGFIAEFSLGGIARVRAERSSCLQSKPSA